MTFTLGGVYNYSEIHSGPLYGTHHSNNAAGFIQIDKKWKKLNISFGARGEYFKLDSIDVERHVYLGRDSTNLQEEHSKVKPIFRAGVNYHLFKATYVRASFGQGFRFPSVAEKYIKTSASGLDIYPNDSLKPESGWSSEIGIKQGIRLGQWKGYLDVAVFWTEYKNMMEFTFGSYGSPVPPSYGLGFQSKNIGNTRIKGVDVSVMGAGKMGPIDVTMLLGYTYIDAIQTDFDLERDSAFNTSKNNLLKYRYKHSGKGDIELGYKKISTGLSVRANSFMENIDEYFVFFFPGMREYRAEHQTGDYIFDYRVSYQMIKTAKISFIVNNMFNREVMGRPMDIQPPRVYVVQLAVKF